MDNITTDYLRYQEEYEKIYNKDQTIVMMQVGSFYEAYATDERGPNLKKLSELTDVVCTKRDKTNKNVDIKNPYMYGFPMVSAQKYFSMIVENNYTVIVIDQITPPPNPKRQVVDILSKGTYVENVYKPESNYIACIYIEEIIQKNFKTLSCIGMAATDLTTGQCCIHEAISNFDDEKYDLDETLRFIGGLAPKEIIIYTNNLKKLTNDSIINYLELSDKNYQIKDMNFGNYKNYTKLDYQQLILKKVYQSESILSIFEELEIDKNIYIRIALSALFDFINNHNPSHIKNIKKPVFNLDQSYLVLGNDAIHQLNIVEGGDSPNPNLKFKSVYDILNKMSTNMGRRFLKQLLVSPYTDPKLLESIYSQVEIFIENDFYHSVENILVGINDIERFERRISVGNIHPMNFSDMLNSYETILSLFNLIKVNDKATKYIKTKKLRGDIRSFIDECNKLFNREKLKIYLSNDIRENIFNLGVFPNVDKLQDQISMGNDVMEELRIKLSDMIADKTVGEKIKLLYNNREGYYYQLSQNRGKALKLIIDKIPQIKLKNHTINSKELEFDMVTKICKIKAIFLKSKTNDLDETQAKIKAETTANYNKTVAELYKKYSHVMNKCSKLITHIDYIKTIAKTSVMYNYVKPVIKERSDKHSYFSGKNIRHCILERIIDVPYVPHDVDLGGDTKGLLVYGINSSGKSVLMRASALLIIMSQIGWFVPASSFTFSPYKALYTRINGSDNMYRGLSSFALEMVELNSILKRADKNTLVVGDEIARGSENIGANALVASAIISLSESNTSFIFTTHLHELTEYINDLQNVKQVHLSVEYDKENDVLVYDRFLKDGSGPKHYAIEVAKNIIKDKKFIERAVNIKNKLLDRYDSITDVNKSRYNNGLIMDKCGVCGKENSLINGKRLETHHIVYQSEFNDKGFAKDESKQHIHKNNISNLVVLCDSCHDKLHDGKINIEGYKMTTKGKKLVIKK